MRNKGRREREGVRNGEQGSEGPKGDMIWRRKRKKGRRFGG